MTNDFEDVMSKRTDSELLKILTDSVDDYQPAALEAAKSELTKRNLTTEQISLAKNEIEQDRNVKDIRANEKLGAGWKLLTFVFPGLIQLVFSGTFKSDGYDRKAKELVKWTFYGFAFYVSLILFISLLN